MIFPTTLFVWKSLFLSLFFYDVKASIEVKFVKNFPCEFPMSFLIVKICLSTDEVCDMKINFAIDL